MNTYQKEQLDALCQARDALRQIAARPKCRLMKEIATYLAFRDRVDRYLDRHLSAYCTRTCFDDRTSACCSRDGILIFWADVVINACLSAPKTLDDMAASVKQPIKPDKCIFLGSSGCLWEVRPLVCAMFLCDQAQADVILRDSDLNAQWERYRSEAKTFRYPDRPVLFDRLELMFMDSGCQSALMYINSSPGLMQVKRKAGLE